MKHWPKEVHAKTLDFFLVSSVFLDPLLSSCEFVVHQSFRGKYGGVLCKHTLQRIKLSLSLVFKILVQMEVALVITGSDSLTSMWFPGYNINCTHLLRPTRLSNTNLVRPVLWFAEVLKQRSCQMQWIVISLYLEPHPLLALQSNGQCRVGVA